ncbi:MAG: hypothetical protein WAK17_04700 [Candidatus Nitrosopolaris sp.]|jgi:hypothetical protein
MTLQKQFEYVYRKVLLNTQWVEAELNDPRDSIAEVDYDSGSGKEMKRERIKKTSTVFFAIVTVTALFAASFIMASQNASAAIVVHHKVAVHHKAHIASNQATAVAVHHKDRTASQGTISVHKVVAVIPETHGASAPELLKIMKSSKGNVIGGTIVDGY